MRSPTVSIIMPMFNEEKFIKICLESIINQEFTSWELIIVDDFSNDQSLQIAHSIAKLDTRIRLMKNNEKGIIPALRLALKSAKGKFITRMDADDIMPKRKLHTLYSRIKDLDSGYVVSGKVKYFSDDVLHEGFKNYEVWINQQDYYKDIYKECTLPSACWMMHASDLRELGGFDGNTYPEDYDLLFRLYEREFTIIGIDQILHLWRDHPSRASRKDPNYMDQNFFDLKMAYFKSIDRNLERRLYLWGAGRKGKKLSQMMTNLGLDFIWLTDNKNKIGKEIYGKKLMSTVSLKRNEPKQVITAISSKNFQENNRDFIESLSTYNCQLFHFC